MAIGTITEIVNNEKLLLQAGTDTFVLMQDCRFNLDRPVSRQTTSGGGVVNFLAVATIALILLCYLAHLKWKIIRQLLIH